MLADAPPVRPMPAMMTCSATGESFRKPEDAATLFILDPVRKIKVLAPLSEGALHLKKDGVAVCCTRCNTVIQWRKPFTFCGYNAKAGAMLHQPLCLHCLEDVVMRGGLDGQEFGIPIFELLAAWCDQNSIDFHEEVRKRMGKLLTFVQECVTHPAVQYIIPKP